MGGLHARSENEREKNRATQPHWKGIGLPYRGERTRRAGVDVEPTLVEEANSQKMSIEDRIPYSNMLLCGGEGPRAWSTN